MFLDKSDFIRDLIALFIISIDIFLATSPCFLDFFLLSLEYTDFGFTSLDLERIECILLV